LFIGTRLKAILQRAVRTPRATRGNGGHAVLDRMCSRREREREQEKNREAFRYLDIGYMDKQVRWPQSWRFWALSL